jgi:HPt (histidine-containing phosphotransfer) domain-containing protein
LKYEEYRQKIISDLEVDDETLKMLIDTFFDSTKDDLKILQEFVLSTNFAGISSKSHAIKGAASSMRFDELARLLKQLELAAKDGCKDDAERLFSQIMLEFDASAIMCDLV